MANTRILIVEDDIDINRIVMKHLTGLGYVCVAAFTGTEGERLIQNESFDLVILDLMLPGIPGEELVKLIRSRNALLPIIVTSARDAIPDKIDLLDLGANDYLAKPFDLDELAARISVHLRIFGAVESNEMITYRDWLINCHIWTLSIHDVPVRLTRTEFSIVALLAANPQKAFSKQEIFESVQNEPYSIDDNTLNVHMSNIRSKLKPSGTDSYIKTVWGLSYTLS